jgi:hypothetical protein
MLWANWSWLEHNIKTNRNEKSHLLVGIPAFTYFLVQCNQPKSKDNSCLIEVKNPSPVDITDAVIEIPVPELAKYINLTDSLKLMILQGNEMIASEIINPGKPVPLC